MKIKNLVRGAGALWLISYNAFAQTIPLVHDISDIETFETSINMGDNPATNINIRQYSSTDKSGGGEFVLDPAGCVSDHGISLNDTHSPTPNCYRRQFSGPVHLSWYGVKDAADPSGPCYTYNMDVATCDATTAVTNALAAAATYGDGSVTTDGRSIALLTQCADCSGTTDAIRILSNQSLTCIGPPGVTRGQTDDTPEPPASPYYQLPHSIVLGQTADLQQLTIRRKSQTDFFGCILRPTWYFPDNPDLHIPAQNVRDTVNIVRHFTGTATTCDGRACNMHDMFILGFDICDDTSQSNKAIIENVGEACLDNEWLHNNGGGMKLQNFSGGAYLEGGFDNDVTSDVWQVRNVLQEGTDGVKIRIDMQDAADPDNIPVVGDTVLVSGLGQGTVAPVSANGRWLVAAVMPVEGSSTLYDILLTGASWAGPTYTASSWKAGAPAIAVYDTTNIIPGQYVCASGTAPFCTPPSGFGFSSVALGAGITGGYTGDVLITGNLQGWPYKGIAQIVTVGVNTEDVSYTLKDASHITITGRGARGTTQHSHNTNDSVTGAAPVVVGVVPTSITLPPALPMGAVIVSAPAQSPNSGTVTFANDTLVSGNNLGNFALNPAYHTWTANQKAGGNPSARLVGIGSHVSADPAHVLTLTNNGWKVQPGMTVADLTTGSNISANATVKSVSGNTVTLQDTDTIGNFLGDYIQFSGCGYPGIGTPSAEPWLGNCAATSVMLGAAGDSGGGGLDEAALGTFCETVHTSAAEIAFHALNASAGSCLNMILDDSGPTGAHADPGSVALWLEGKVTKSQFGNARLSGYATSILDAPTVGFQPDGVAVSNAQIFGDIVLGADANIGLGLLHGQLNPPETGFVFAPAAMQAAHIDSAQLPDWSVYFDDTAALAKLYCAANKFANAPCAQVKGTPTCGAGCGGVSGNDSNFDVTVSGPATSITVTLAAQYAAAPICTATASPSSGGTVITATVSSVSLQPWGTTVTFKTSSAPQHIYGSCRGATG